MKQKKALAIILSLSMALSLSACGSANGSDESQNEGSSISENESKIADTALSLIDSTGHSDKAGKEETVYVISDANGNPKQTIVSAWLKNAEGSDTLSDKTELTDIENTKGDEDYTQGSDSDITWNAAGNDIYYRGNSNKETPISVNVKYELDGKETDADSLAGADGHLKITFAYTNNTGKQEKVDGKNVTIYKPYIVISGLMLENETASNIEVTNGQVVNDGENSIVVGMAMPGLSESLGLDELEDETDTSLDIDIPEEVTIEADVTDFSLLTTLTVATDDALNQLGLDDISDTSDLQDKVDELTDGSGKLVDGTSEFNDYMGQLDDSTGLLTDGADSLSTNMETLSSGLETVQSSISGLPDGTAKLLAGTNALKTALKSGYNGSDISKYGIYEAVRAIAQGASSISSGASGVMSGAEKAKQAADGIAAGAISGDTSDPSKYGIYEGANAIKAGAKSGSSDPESYGIYEAAAAIKAGVKSGSSDPESYGIYEAAAAVKSGLTTKISTLMEKLGEAGTNLDTAAGYDSTAATLINNVLSTGENLTDDQKTALSQASAAASGAQKLTSGVKDALSGVSIDLSDATAALDKIMGGAETIYGAADKIAAGADSIYSGADRLASGAQSINSYAKLISAGLKSGDMSSPENYGIYEAAYAIKSGADSLNAAANKILSSIDTMTNSDNMGALVSGLESLNSSSGTLIDAIEKLTTGSKQLSSGSEELSSGISKAGEAISELYDASKEIKDGMAELDSDGIQKIADLVNDDLTSFLDRLQAVKDYAEEAESYSGCPDGIECSTKYIYKTAEISAE